MPELPEVETVRRGLQNRTAGLTIDRIQVLLQRSVAAPENPALFAEALAGCRIQRWSRRGKYLLADLLRGQEETAGLWGVHLRMTGQFLWLEEPREPSTHTRVRILTTGGGELRFVDTRTFGQMWWVPPGIEACRVITGLERLGPEPFSDLFSVPYLRGRLRGSLRPIKNALLDQRLVAGIGNIYADESLFMAGILPQTPGRRLTSQRLNRLREALVHVLSSSIGAGGTTFRDFRDLSGTNGNYGGRAWVYRRGGLPCRHCGTTIRRERLAGRSTHWCPRCQR